MTSYIIRRIIIGIIIVFAVITAVFFSMHLMPGDPVDAMFPPGSGVTSEMVEEIESEYGFDQPIYVQYYRYLQRLVNLDFGESYISGRTVSSDLISRYPYTINLTIAGMIIAIVIGIFTGIISSLRPNTIYDNISRIIALAGISIPSFWLGLLLILFFSLRLDWLPSMGAGGPLWTLSGIQHIILPAVALGLAPGALIMRLTRSSMLEVLRSDYLRTARAKGLNERTVVYRHALRNALIPIVTVIGLRFGVALGGAVVIEQVFSYPGIGRYLIEAITSSNFPAAQGAILFMSFGFILINIIVDISYVFIDPTIAYD